MKVALRTVASLDRPLQETETQVALELTTGRYRHLLPAGRSWLAKYWSRPSCGLVPYGEYAEGSWYYVRSHWY
jgi:hypothetical protein